MLSINKFYKISTVFLIEFQHDYNRNLFKERYCDTQMVAENSLHTLQAVSGFAWNCIFSCYMQFFMLQNFNKLSGVDKIWHHNKRPNISSWLFCFLLVVIGGKCINVHETKILVSFLFYFMFKTIFEGLSHYNECTVTIVIIFSYAYCRKLAVLFKICSR